MLSDTPHYADRAHNVTSATVGRRVAGGRQQSGEATELIDDRVFLPEGKDHARRRKEAYAAAERRLVAQVKGDGSNVHPDILRDPLDLARRDLDLATIVGRIDAAIAKLHAHEGDHQPQQERRNDEPRSRHDDSDCPVASAAPARAQSEIGHEAEERNPDRREDELVDERRARRDLRAHVDAYGDLPGETLSVCAAARSSA